jgi:hypothetical protein
MRKKGGYMYESTQFNEKRYKSSVLSAKQALKVYNQRSVEAETARNKVAEIALRIRPMCKLTKFSVDIGLKYSTMMQWVSDREKTTKIIDAKKSASSPINQEVVSRVIKKIGKNTTKKKIKEIYELENRKAPEDIELENNLNILLKIKHNICHSFSLEKMDQELLVNFYRINSDITDKLDIYFGVKDEGNNYGEKRQARNTRKLTGSEATQ